MRDVLITLVVLAGVPFMLRSPYIGIMYWAWIGLMNPHRLAYGFAYGFPFAAAVGGLTLIGLFATREERRWKGAPEIYILITLILWMSLTTLQAMEPELAQPKWVSVMKVQVMMFVALMVLQKPRHVELMIWVLALSIGFFSVKGGLFTIATGGSYRVWGPPDSAIEDNNSLALATVMIIPLLYYLAGRVQKRWLRMALWACMVLSAASALGSHSRGALLAIGAMGLLLWAQSRKKLFSGLLMGILAAGLVAFMPSNWDERMETISKYEEDDSAMGRIHTWTMLWRIANDRFLGAGFEPYTQETFDRYSPQFPTVHAAHSIYFQMLGEHGYVGLALFLAMWLMTWRSAGFVIRAARDRPEWAWAGSLARAFKTSIAAYLVGGAFLNLAYWDLPYYEMVLLVVMRWQLRRIPANSPDVVSKAETSPFEPVQAMDRVPSSTA